MGGFFGLGGSKDVKEGIGSSKNIYNKALGLVDPTVDASKTTGAYGMDLLHSGVGTTRTGLNTLGQAKDYFSRIMSGTRPEMMAAVAPEINAVNETADASRLGQATFGTQRGGGVNAANQAAETGRMTDINNALFAARPAAAKEVEKIGGTEADIGLGVGRLGTTEQDVSIRQLEAGLRALGLSEDTINNMTRNAVANRQASTAAWSSLFNSLLGGGLSFGGGGPKIKPVGEVPIGGS